MPTDAEAGARWIMCNIRYIHPRMPGSKRSEAKRSPMHRTVLSFVAILCALAGCGPAPESPSKVARNAAAPAVNSDPLHVVQHTNRPELTAEKIAHDMIGRVVQVSDLTGSEPATDWTFEAAEFRKVDVLENHATEKGLTLLIFITTRNNPVPDEDNVQVSGKLKLEYEWQAGKWILGTIENLTFRYSVGLAA